MTNVISWPVPKEIIKEPWTATLSSENQIFLTLTAYFDPNKYTLIFIAKIKSFLNFKLINFLVRTPQCTAKKIVERLGIQSS